MPYLVTFLLTGLLAFAVPKATEGTRRVVMVASVIPICALSALRSDVVGTDMLVYVIPNFYSSAYKSLLDILSGSSPLFNFMAWFSRVVFDSRTVYLFLIQLVIIAPIYSVFYRRAKSDAWIAITLYNLIFYSYTLNLVRQSCAVSIVFFASQFLLDKNYKHYCFFELIALGFHQTAIVGLVFPLTYFVLNSFKDFHVNLKRRIGAHHKIPILDLNPRTVVLAGSVLMVFAVLFSFDWLVTLKESYSYQASHGGSTDFKMFVAWAVFAAELWLLNLEGNRTSGQKDSADKELYEISTQSACIIYLLCLKSVELFRLSLYQFVSFPLYTTLLYRDAKKTKRAKILLLLILGTAAFFWFWKFVCQGVGAVFPYEMAGWK